ncbi:MAG TPA: trimethylamine methyltransferase family protein [Acidimicrobiia bacterium]|nr:trimethylamine methyltransferase family protein [Acidimicrobiia bacterium]
MNQEAGAELATRRRPRRERRAVGGRTEPRYRRLVNPFQPLQVLSDDEIAGIHQAALTILAEDGIKVLLADGRRRFENTGASVDEDFMVRIDPELVTSALESAPSEFELVARNPDRNVLVGGRGVVLAPVGGPPHATDLDRGRRAGTLQDFCDLLRLSQAFDVIHVTSQQVEPQDVGVNLRHLETTRAYLALSDKAPFIYSRGLGQVTDCLEMLRIGLGLTEDELVADQYCYTVINTNSPRQLDVPMALGLIQFAEMNQPAIVTPFTLSGAMAPVTLAGALVLQHAEALAGITLSQISRRGAPVVYGAFTSNVDMRSGAPAFGTPEAAKAAFASGQLARHIGLPWRSSAVCTSNTPDAQAGYESMMNMLGAALGGANFILHTAGWLESGLSASYEKFILDVEMAQMFAELFLPLDSAAPEMGLEAIHAVQPGGHFFGVDHTLERYEKAFYEPVVFSRANFGQWEEGGSLTAAQRANAVWKQILADFEPPFLDDGIKEELDEYVRRRTAEGGAPPES